MFKKILSTLGIAAGIFTMASLSFAQQTTTTTSSTTVEATTVKSAPAPAKKRVVKTSKPAAKPVEATAVTSTTTTVEVVKPPPPKEVVRKVYDEEQLKKMEKTLCSNGFKAFISNDKKNVCLSKANSPDIAYTCVWDKDGIPAFAPNTQGPCNLDYTEHQGSIVIKKETFDHDPPLKYGTEAQCCFRAAKGIETQTPVSAK